MNEEEPISKSKGLEISHMAADNPTLTGSLAARSIVAANISIATESSGNESEIDNLGPDDYLELLESTDNVAALNLASSFFRDESERDRTASAENLQARGIKAYSLSPRGDGFVGESNSLSLAKHPADLPVITDRHTMLSLPTSVICRVPLDQGPYVKVLVSSCSVLVATTETDLLVAHVLFSDIQETDTALEFMKSSGVDLATIRVVANTDPSTSSASGRSIKSIEDYAERGIAVENIVTYAARGSQEGDATSRPGPVEIMVNSAALLARRLRTVRTNPTNYLGYLENKSLVEI